MPNRFRYSPEPLIVKWPSDPAGEISFSISRRTVIPVGKLFKRPFSKAAASEEARRTLRYVEPLSDARTKLAVVFNSFLFVVLVFRVKYFLSLLLFHGVMQEHPDKH